MLAKTHEALIAQAQEAARNKFATSHVNAAHARLIEALINNPPPAFDISGKAADFEAAHDFLTTVAAACDDLVQQVMAEAKANARTTFTPHIAVVSDALNDCDALSELTNEAEYLREDA